MKRLLRQLLPIEPGEELKIAQFALLGLLLQAGLALGMSAADSAFLATAGADKLPRIYLSIPVVMLAYIPAYSALLGRWGMDRVVDATLGLLAAGGAVLWLLFTRSAPAALWPCYVAKLYAAVWYVGLYTLYWNFIDGYFDLFDAKRVFALFAAGSAAGAILGGFLVGPISRRYGVNSLFLAWAVAAAAAWPVAFWIRRRWHKIESSEDDTPATTPFLAQNLGGIVKLLRSRFGMALSVVLFLTLVAATTCEFQYLGIFAQGRDEAAIAALLGRLTALVNIFNLGVTLLLFNRLVKWLGVRNVALIQSLAYAAVFSWLLLDGGFPAALAGFFAYQGLMTAVDFNNINLLFSGLPAEDNKQLRAVIEGFCEPMATATAGLLLLLFASRLSPEQIALAGVGVALATLAFGFVLRSDYAAAIGTNLRRNWLDLSRVVEPLWRRALPSDLDLAEARVRAAAPGEATLALRLLWLGDPPRAVRALLKFLPRAAPESRTAVQPLLDEVLANPTSSAAQEIHRWLEDEEVDPDPELAGEFGRRRLLPVRQTEALLLNPEPDAQAAAAATLWQSWRVADSKRALVEVEKLLSSGDEKSLRAGLRALGRLGEPRYAYMLRDYLGFPSDEVRLTALSSLRGLASPSSRVLVPELLSVLRENFGIERMLALDALEKIGDSESLRAMLEAAETFTPAERRRLERLILRFGPRAVPVLVETLQDSRFSGAPCSVALRALGKLALPQLHLIAAPLVAAIAARSYLFLAARAALEKEDSGESGRAVLVRICADDPLSALDLILEILAVAGRLPNYEAMVAAVRSGRSKERGYAIETIEQACDRATFELLLPLLDGRPLSDQVDFARARRIVPKLSGWDVLDRTLETGHPLASAAAAQAILAGERPEAAERVLARVARTPHPLLAETAALCLARRAGRVSRNLTPVEAVRRFMAEEAFSSFSSIHYEFLAPQVSPADFADGTVICRGGEPLPGIWLVQSGGVRDDQGSSVAVPGAEALRGAGRAASTLTAVTDTRALFVPLRELLRCAEIFPELGLSLLAKKLAA